VRKSLLRLLLLLLPLLSQATGRQTGGSRRHGRLPSASAEVALRCALVIIAEAIPVRVDLLSWSVAVIRSAALLLKALLRSMSVVSGREIPSATDAPAGPTAPRPRILSQQRGGTLAPTPGHPVAAGVLGGGTAATAGRHALQHAPPLISAGAGRGDGAGRSRRTSSAASAFGLLLPPPARRGAADGAHGTPQANLGGLGLSRRHGAGVQFAA